MASRVPGATPASAAADLGRHRFAGVPARRPPTPTTLPPAPAMARLGGVTHGGSAVGRRVRRSSARHHLAAAVDDRRCDATASEQIDAQRQLSASLRLPIRSARAACGRRAARASRGKQMLRRGAASRPGQRRARRAPRSPARRVPGRRKLPIVEVVAIERDQRAAQLARQAVVLDVAGAAQVGMVHHEQHVPAQRARA